MLNRNGFLINKALGGEELVKFKKAGMILATLLVLGMAGTAYNYRGNSEEVEMEYAYDENREDIEGEITGHDDETSEEESEEYATLENVVLEEDGKLELSHELLNLAVEYHGNEYTFTEPRLENLGYKVKKGDTISTIAKRFNTSSDYLMANNLDIDLSTLRVGREIKIPNETGIFYRVEKNDSFMSLEKKFSISEEIVKEDNNIEELKQGEVIFLREPTIASEFKKKMKTVVAAQKRAASVFASPLNRLIVTSKYGSRRHPVLKQTIHHAGVDLKAPVGTKVMSAKSGTVTFAGYSGNYGYLVVVSHPDGYETRYAHLSKVKVKKGQKVNSRQLIALSGNTGRSTGPHLHFEVRRNGKALNPIAYVRG